MLDISFHTLPPAAPGLDEPGFPQLSAIWGTELHFAFSMLKVQVLAFSGWPLGNNIQCYAVSTKLARAGCLASVLINQVKLGLFFDVITGPFSPLVFLLHFPPWWERYQVQSCGVNETVFTLLGISLSTLFFWCALTLSQKGLLSQLGGSYSIPAFPADVSFVQQIIQRLIAFKHSVWPS